MQCLSVFNPVGLVLKPLLASRKEKTSDIIIKYLNYGKKITLFYIPTMLQ